MKTPAQVVLDLAFKQLIEEEFPFDDYSRPEIKESSWDLGEAEEWLLKIATGRWQLSYMITPEHKTYPALR